MSSLLLTRLLRPRRMPRSPMLAAPLASLAAAALLVLPGAAAAASPSEDTLLASIRAQAPDTTAIGTVSASPDGTRLAILTFARGASDTQVHDELWLADAAGSVAQPLQSGNGSGAEYGRINGLAWARSGATLAYSAQNPVLRPSSAAHVVWTSPDGSFEDRSLGALTRTPVFTADGRYLTFLRGTVGQTSVSHGAVDLASRGVLFPARTDPVTVGDQPSAPSLFAPECLRASEPDWAPAQATGAWMEQALSSPDPGCRFGANAADPGRGDDAPVPTPTPTSSPAPSPVPAAATIAGASDAPASITKPSPGTGLVPISERTTPLGPTVRIRSSSKRLSRAVRDGIRLRIEVAGARQLRAYVLVARPADEKLFGVGSNLVTSIIGRLTVKSPPSQAQTIAIPLTAEARATLPRFLKLTVTVRLIATDLAGNRTLVERQLPMTDL